MTDSQKSKDNPTPAVLTEKKLELDLERHKNWRTWLKEGRVGIFIVPDDVIERYPAFVNLLTQDMLILRAERRFDVRGMEYVAIHEGFPSKKEDTVAPRYHLNIIMGKMEISEEDRVELKLDEFGPVYTEIRKV